MSDYTDAYVIRMPKGYFGHDSITGNVTLNGTLSEAKTYTDKFAAERDARYMIGSYVEIKTDGKVLI